MTQPFNTTPRNYVQTTDNVQLFDRAIAPSSGVSVNDLWFDTTTTPGVWYQCTAIGPVVWTAASGSATLAGDVTGASGANTVVKVQNVAISSTNATALSNLTGVNSGDQTSVSGNAGTVTNGIYTTDTGTVTNTMLAGSIANNKLVNTAVANLSGTNTGDQTNITGNAATVTTNANLTGPVTSTGNSTAIANGAITNAMLANSAVANLSGTNTGDQTLPIDSTITTTDNTTNNVSTSKHGWCPKLPGGTTTFLRADGSYAVAGSSAPVTTKGDLYGYDSAGNRVPVGSNYQLLKADSTATLGLSYDYPDPPLTKSSIVVSYDAMGGSQTAADNVPATSINGTGAVVGIDTSITDGSMYGVVTCSTGSTTTGRAYWKGSGASIFVSGGQLILETSLRIPTLSNGTDRFAVSIGFNSGNPGSGKFNDGPYFYYRDDVNSGNWQCECASFGTSGTPHIITTSTSASTSETRFKIVIDATCANIYYYINDTLVATDSTATNMPLNTGLVPVVGLLKSLGTNSLNILIDYIKVRKDFTTAR